MPIIPTGPVSYMLDDLVVVHNYVDDNQVRWGIEDIEGLDGLGDTGTVEQYPADPGGWPLPAVHTPREVTVVGWLVSPHWSFTTTAIEQIKAALPLSTLGDLTVSITGDRDRLLRVRQQGKPLFKRDGRFCNYNLSLVAPDPRVYATELTVVSTGLPSSSGGLTLPFSLPTPIAATTVSGVLTVVNEGNMATRPLLRVSGPCPPFTLTHHSGRTLSYPYAVAAGRFIELDTATRVAREDGTAVRPVSGAWFDYSPGMNTVAFAASSYDAGALLTSTHRSAWK